MIRSIFFIVLFALISPISKAQQLKLFRPDTAYLFKQMKTMGHNKTLGYLYLEKYYKIKSRKDSIRFKYDYENQKYECGYFQKFGNGITYEINNCPDAVMFETITFPNTDAGNVKGLVKILFHDSENTWITPLHYGPPAAGCNYRIKKLKNSTVLEIECGC